MRRNSKNLMSGPIGLFDSGFGGLHVLAKVSKPISGTFASGTAGNGLKIGLTFFEQIPTEPKPKM